MMHLTVKSNANAAAVAARVLALRTRPVILFDGAAAESVLLFGGITGER
jgi:hypothetical protein